MRTGFDSELEQRLLRYTAIDTQSDENSPGAPSTSCQLDLLRLLKTELEEIGAEEVVLTDYGAVLATLPATVPTDAPVMAWLAHVDTAPQFNASGVRPVVHRNYNGGAISFADAPGLVLSPEEFPELARCAGHDIVTASRLLAERRVGGRARRPGVHGRGADVLALHRHRHRRRRERRHP